MPLLSAAACVALADWLFYGWQVGISLALFFAVLGIVAVAGNRARATPALQAVMAAIFVAGLLALIEDVNILSTTMGALATAPFVIVITACDARSWRRDLFEAVTIPFRGPFQLAGDLIGALNLRKRQAPEWLSTSSLVAWIIPLAAFAVFLALLASARLAAFIWMVLVAVGLLMMLIQIELRKPNSWLDRRQRDFAGRRAVWMLLHQRAATGGVLQCGALPGSRRDGPQSRSAISRLAGAAGAALRRSPCEKVPVLWSIAWDFRHIHETRPRPGNWRGWSFRTWRLERYLANNPSIASNLSGSDRG